MLPAAKGVTVNVVPHTVICWGTTRENVLPGGWTRSADERRTAEGRDALAARDTVGEREGGAGRRERADTAWRRSPNRHRNPTAAPEPAPDRAAPAFTGPPRG